jgi:hypothetical protein
MMQLSVEQTSSQREIESSTASRGDTLESLKRRSVWRFNDLTVQALTSETDIDADQAG